jgi:hypothetical protein
MIPENFRIAAVVSVSLSLAIIQIEQKTGRYLTGEITNTKDQVHKIVY